MDHVEQALMLLEENRDDSTHPPAVVVLPPNAGDFIIGNRGGFVQLAIAALKAAAGEQQPFEGKSWVHTEDPDWAVSGLKPDQSAHIYLPQKFTRFQRFKQQAVGVFVVLLISVIFVIGFATTVGWLFKHA